MKFLVFLLMFIPFFASADMVEVSVGGGQGTKTFYGADYEFVKGISYVDMALSGNNDYVQPYISTGLQFDHFNFGLAAALSMSSYYNGAFQGQLSFGPEIGYMQNLTNLVYIKESNSYMGYAGQYNFTSTLSIGFNL